MTPRGRPLPRRPRTGPSPLRRTSRSFHRVPKIGATPGAAPGRPERRSSARRRTGWWRSIRTPRPRPQTPQGQEEAGKSICLYAIHPPARFAVRTPAKRQTTIPSSQNASMRETDCRPSTPPARQTIHKILGIDRNRRAISSEEWRRRAWPGLGKSPIAGRTPSR